MNYQLHHGDCLAILPTLEDCSVDAIVTDPPAGIAFMGKAWDRDKGGKAEWIAWMQSVATECLRVIKPGGHALVWAIPRTSHWTGDAWEEAGWQVREKIYHVFGSGFPKSLDVSKAINKAAGAEREVVGIAGKSGSERNSMAGDFAGGEYAATAPATPEAKQWAGWGTALKPAAEEWWLFRKPLEGTVAANVLKHGTGAINVDGCRVGLREKRLLDRSGSIGYGGSEPQGVVEDGGRGRWPANFTHDGGDEVEALLGDAARFFYSPKASKKDRDEGCEGMEERGNNRYGEFKGTGDHAPKTELHNKSRNHHPTVKPTDLMSYLCRLITPPGGIILDPFTGSGSTGKAAIIEDFRFIGIEREAEYIEIARARIEEAVQYRKSFLF